MAWVYHGKGRRKRKEEGPFLSEWNIKFFPLVVGGRKPRNYTTKLERSPAMVYNTEKIIMIRYVRSCLKNMAFFNHPTTVTL